MYESYINLRQNIISWKKLGIDPKTALPVLGTLPTKVDFCGHGDAINMVPKSLNNGCYGGYTQYDSIRKLRTAHANIYGEFMEGAMNYRQIRKDNQ